MSRLAGSAATTVWLTGCALFLICALAAGRPIQAQTATAEQDAFQQCVVNGSGSGTTCLSRLGEKYAWRPTETACRFVAGKVGAIIEAGGQVKWIELFYNERCARLGFPNDATAAAAGAKVDFESPFVQCAGNKKYESHFDCYDLLGRHSVYPRAEIYCAMNADWIRGNRAGEYGLSYYTLFRHERCWRLGLSHYKGQ